MEVTSKDQEIANNDVLVCSKCIEDFNDRSEKLFRKIEQDHAKMRDAFTIFIETVSNKFDKEKDDLKSEVHKDTDKSISNARWTLSIVIGTAATFILLVAGGSGYVIRELELKSYKNETLSIEDTEIILDLSDKYDEERYVHQNGSVVDPSNYNLFIKTTFERAKRGGIEKNK